MLKEAGVIQVCFSHVPCMDDRESEHVDKENMMKNIQQYLFMGFQKGDFRMTMVKATIVVTDNYFSSPKISTLCQSSVINDHRQIVAIDVVDQKNSSRERENESTVVCCCLFKQLSITKSR